MIEPINSIGKAFDVLRIFWTKNMLLSFLRMKLNQSSHLSQRLQAGWDPLLYGKEVIFIQSIWHKAVVVDEWKACISPASVSKERVFCVPNT